METDAMLHVSSGAELD